MNQESPVILRSQYNGGSVNRNNFILDIRMYYSLLNMMEYAKDFTPEYYGSTEERAKNVNIGLTIGYLIDIGK